MCDDLPPAPPGREGEPVTLTVIDQGSGEIVFFYDCRLPPGSPRDHPAPAATQ
ncbi:hypothetical protein [Actinoplanes sp. CA-252034]|uniref:hypothetical protein n=1 Tax=Actinoplanes sp. CA-252034 TaxID=3239906 RepID=UPI003D99BBE5